MDLGDFDHINRIISASGPTWLGEAYLPHFDRLVATIEAMKRPDDNFQIPDRRQSGAWQEAFPIYDRLRRRAEEDAASPAAQERRAEVFRQADKDKAWNFYIADRVALIDEMKRSAISQKVLMQFFRLEEDDLIDPVDRTAPRSQRLGWQDRAYNVTRAYGLWAQMSPDERKMIPSRVAAMRVEKLASDMKFIHETCFPALVAEINRLQERLSAVEAFGVFAKPEETKQ
jgi:hypothetical protein